MKPRTCCLIIVGLIVSVWATACTPETKPAGPTFSGRLFFLSADKGNGADLSELTAGPMGAANSYQVVTSGVFGAVPSPDQAKLLYSTKDGIMLRDFASGAVKALVKGDSTCLAWAPDGNHFSYKQKAGETTKLYASDTEGKAKLILDYPNDSKDCAQWISTDRIVFDRFVGAAVKKANEQLKPNTTTVATIGDSVKLKDAPRKWAIESVCANSNNGFVRSADQGKLLIAKNIDHFETIDPSPAPCSECRFIGYAAQSCVPFFVEQPTSATTDLFYLNPTSWQKQRPSTINRTFSPSAKALIKSSAKLMIIGDTANLFLVDTESGAIVSLLDKSLDSANSNSIAVPIVWIEK
jgi:hypothetical protein